LFGVLSCEVIFRFVNIGRIVYHRCSHNFNMFDIN
jgi:hypothetical protein